MSHLYVCLFSNGCVKVGRSIDPKGRIASHAERVSCMGVELTDFRAFECAGSPVVAEQHLIERCRDEAQSVKGSEWFFGLCFATVCEWAQDQADCAYAHPVRSGRSSQAQTDALKRAIALVGGSTKMANALTEARDKKVTVQAVTNWLTRGTPPEYCPLIEKLTAAQVRCEELNGDVDWSIVRESSPQTA